MINKNSNGCIFDTYCNGQKPACIFCSNTEIHLQGIIIIWALCIEKVCIQIRDYIINAKMCDVFFNKNVDHEE